MCGTVEKEAQKVHAWAEHRQYITWHLTTVVGRCNLSTVALKREDRDWRQLRLSTGLTLTELASRAALNKGTVSAIETRRMHPTPSEAAAILRVLETARQVT